MDGEEFARLLQEHAEEIQDFTNNVFPYLAGDIAVNHFKENFEKEGFVNDGLQPWDDVKRRDPESPWYGFAPENKSRFSSTRAEDTILKDSTELVEAIDYDPRGNGEVAIVNDKPYAQVHNEGGQAYVFGKTPFEMPKRQFIGASKELDVLELDMIEEELDGIIGKE